MLIHDDPLRGTFLMLRARAHLGLDREDGKPESEAVPVPPSGEVI